MASKRHLRRKQCGTKIRHATKGGAQYHAYLLMRKGEKIIGWYYCKFCNGWHVGHKPAKLRIKPDIYNQARFKG